MTNTTRKAAAGITALLLAAACLPALPAAAAEEPPAPRFGEVTEMPSDPFGSASASSPYHKMPCNERLATLPEPLMKLTDDGYTWSGAYGAGKPAWALTLMDYANIYSYIHTHDIDPDTLRAVLADADSMLHRRAFSAEEIELLLGDDEAAAMKAFASPGTVVIGNKGYSAGWMYAHSTEEYAAEGITPEMVAAVLPYYYNPLYTQKAADAFSQKLYLFTRRLAQTKWHQWKAGDTDLNGRLEQADAELLQSYLDGDAALTFPQWASADMNGDSHADSDDLAALRRKLEEGEAESGVMLDVIEFCQYPDYPTGCESVSLYMLLDYYGVDVQVDDIYDLLPMGAQPYDDENGVRHGANPEREFVGDPRSEYSYGVFNDPIAGVADRIKPGVRTERGVQVSRIREVLDSGNPVLAWYVSAPMREIMYRWSWLDERGETVTWPGGEHAVVICGYDGDSLTYRDPNAGTTVCIDYATFEKSFSELGGRIVYYTGDEDTEAVSYVSESGRTLYTRPTVLNGSETALEAGWYTVTSDVTVDRALMLSGDVSLILADGCTLTVNGGISGEGALSVFGQTAGTGVLNVTAADTAVSTDSFTAYGGKTVLESDAEFALTGREAVRLLGGQFESNAGVRSAGRLTLGYANADDYILAAAYQAEETIVRDGQALFLPDTDLDLSTLLLSDSITLPYNGEMQQPTKEDVLGSLWMNEPIYTENYIYDTWLNLARNRKLCPYTGTLGKNQITLETLLGPEDFDIVSAEAGRDVASPDSGDVSAEYAIELVGKGSFTGSVTLSWNIEPADVSDDIQVTVQSPLSNDGTPLTAEDFSITASAPLAQELLDDLAAGKAEAPFAVYSLSPLTGDSITAEVKPDTALEHGHIYDLNELGMFLGLLIEADTDQPEMTVLQYGDLNKRIYVNRDGERLNGCVELDAEGCLRYYKVGADGSDTLIEVRPDPYMQWVIEKSGDIPMMPLYILRRNFTAAQRSEGTEPGRYAARMIIYETDTASACFKDVTKIIPFEIVSDEAGQIAPDVTLLRWAEKDYQDKTGTPVTASAAEKKDGILTIALTDPDGSTVDTYVIDTADGTGSDGAEQAVNLPQTGRSSLTDLLCPALALMLLAAGAYGVHASGIFRRRTHKRNSL